MQRFGIFKGREKKRFVSRHLQTHFHYWDTKDVSLFLPEVPSYQLANLVEEKTRCLWKLFLSYEYVVNQNISVQCDLVVVCRFVEKM